MVPARPGCRLPTRVAVDLRATGDHLAGPVDGGAPLEGVDRQSPPPSHSRVQLAVLAVAPGGTVAAAGTPAGSPLPAACNPPVICSPGLGAYMARSKRPPLG